MNANERVRVALNCAANATVSQRRPGRAEERYPAWQRAHQYVSRMALRCSVYTLSGGPTYAVTRREQRKVLGRRHHFSI